MEKEKPKKDYSRYFAPEFEEVCDRAEELARAEGETREGVLSMIRHPGWGILPPQLEACLPWAKEMRRKAAARIAAEREREQEKQEQKNKEKESNPVPQGRGLRSAVSGFVFSPPRPPGSLAQVFSAVRANLPAGIGARTRGNAEPVNSTERRKRPAPNSPGGRRPRRRGGGCGTPQKGCRQSPARGASP